mmetsp:Transcript_7068/g.10567  ORF Transcript_7068/g.10567 Transcript_7068/m.10567 type:complete len:222 (+) Transcript_7068:164-829(+)
MKQTTHIIVRQRVVKADEIIQVNNGVDPELLLKTLRGIDHRYIKEKGDSVRAMIIRRMFEEICYPPIDFVGLTDWFDDTLHISLPTGELRNLLKYIGLYKPLEYQQPKDALAHFLKECDLTPPTPLTQVAWLDEIISLERYRVACQINPHGEPPPTASIKVRTEEPKMSRVLSFIGSMWIKGSSSSLVRRTNNSKKSTSLKAKVHVTTVAGSRRRGRRGTV